MNITYDQLRRIRFSLCSSFGYYLSINNEGNAQLVSNTLDWEIFNINDSNQLRRIHDNVILNNYTVHIKDNNMVSLRYRDNQYLSVDNNNKQNIIRRDNNDKWEKFKVVEYNHHQQPSVYIASLRANGFCIIENLLSLDTIADIKALINEASNRRGTFTNLEITGRKGIQERIGKILKIDPVFAEVVCNPLVCGIVAKYIGNGNDKDFHLATWSSNNLLPQDPNDHDESKSGLGWHVDYPFENFPDWPNNSNENVLGVQALFSIDEFNERNGSPLFLKNSHLNDSSLLQALQTNPYSIPADSVQALIPAGSVLIAHSAWIHRQTVNRSGIDRLGLLANYTRKSIQPKDDMNTQYDHVRQIITSDHRSCPESKERLLNILKDWENSEVKVDDESKRNNL